MIPPQETVGKALVDGDFETFFPFKVTKPGDYQAYCTSSDGAQSSTASFRVIEAGVLITEPQEQSTSADVVFTSGGLWFTYENGIAGWCLPGVNYKDYGGVSSLDVAADGALSGKCAMSIYGRDNPINSTLDGTWDKTTGKISFHLNTVMTYNATVNKGTQNEQSGNFHHHI